MERYATRNGLRKIQERMQTLEEQLSEVQKKMGEAASQSSETWHDNAPFEVLRADVAIFDRRLKDELAAVVGCQIREYPQQVTGGIVGYGVNVVIIRDGKEFSYKLVGYGDEDSDLNRIRYDSPLAQALIGRSIGEKFIANINCRKSQIEIREADPIKDEDLINPRY